MMQQKLSKSIILSIDNYIIINSICQIFIKLILNRCLAASGRSGISEMGAPTSGLLLPYYW